MNSILRVSMIVGLMVYYGFIFFLLKRRTLALKYTLVWMAAGVIMLFCALFPSVLKWVINRLGIVELTNGLFAMILFFLLIISMIITSIVSKLNEQIRMLAQRCGLYEKRIRELENILECRKE